MKTITISFLFCVLLVNNLWGQQAIQHSNDTLEIKKCFDEVNRGILDYTGELVTKNVDAQTIRFFENILTFIQDTTGLSSTKLK